MTKETDSTIDYLNIPELNNGKSEIYSLFDAAISLHASDLILSSGSMPTVRVDGKLLPIFEKPRLTHGYIEKLVKMLISEEQEDILLRDKELDFSYIYKDKAFLRINVYYQKNTIACVVRVVPGDVKSFDELGLPLIIKKFALESHGLVLVTGPSGSGKSTTIASLIEEINRTRAEHILTIEDPIEYIFKPKQSIIDQRELKRDTLSYSDALKSSFREDFDVVLIGELRDAESMEAALNIAEAGHLVFASIHSADAASTPDRLINAFPSDSQDAIRHQLSNVLLGVVAQRLVPRIDGGRVAVVEIMLSNQAVQSLIRESKTHQLKSIIQTSASEGMVTFEKSLEELINRGKILPEYKRRLR